MKKYLLLFFSFLTFGQIYPQYCHALTLSQVRTEIRRCIRDNPSDSSLRRYSDSVLLDFINESQREIVNYTWLADKTTAYTLTGNVTYYNLPTDYLTAHQVYFTNTSNQTIELQFISQKVLYDTNPSWERNTGTPSYYWLSVATNPQSQQSAPMRVSYIPIPTRTSTGTATIWYYCTVPDLSSDTDVPFENRRHLYQYHFALVYYVSARIKEIEGKIDEANIYQKRYENYIFQTKSNLGKAPGYNPSMNLPSTNR